MNSNPLKNTKLKFNLISKYLFLIIILVIIISFSFLGFFLYKNFYRPLSSAEPIYIPVSLIAFQRIDINLLNKIITKIEEKNKREEIDWGAIKNPFIPY